MDLTPVIFTSESDSLRQHVAGVSHSHYARRSGAPLLCSSERTSDRSIGVPKPLDKPQAFQTLGRTARFYASRFIPGWPPASGGPIIRKSHWPSLSRSVSGKLRRALFFISGRCAATQHPFRV